MAREIINIGAVANDRTGDPVRDAYIKINNMTSEIYTALGDGTLLNAALGIPPGGIIMWSGAIVNIPDGWALCDGTNGTPNLQDRFIVGAGSTYAVGDTGGAATNTLSTAQLPSHTHSFSATTNITGSHGHTASSNSTGAHTHSVSGTAASAGNHNHAVNANITAGAVRILGSETNSFAGFENTGSGITWYQDGTNMRIEGAHTHSVSGTAASGGSHSHTITVNSNGDHSHTVSGTTGAQGSGSSIENRPPYYALAYIMKL